MDFLKAAGVSLVSSLQQTRFAQYAVTLHRLTYYSTPLFMLTVLWPVLAAVHGTALVPGTASPVAINTAALPAIWTTIVALRLNVFKQWTLGEDRPYWWVKETAYYNRTRAPYLEQFPITCLTSPGSPSHSLLAGSAGLVVVLAAVRLVRLLFSSNEKQQKWAEVITWSVYGSFIGLTALADIFFSSYFPHQVIVSIAVGTAIAMVMMSMDFSKPSSFRRTVAINVVLLSISLGALFAGDANSFNTYQKKAFRWCLRREWLQIDPTPLLDAFTLTGFAVGTAAGSTSRYFAKLNKLKFSRKMTFSVIVLSLCTVQLVLLAIDVVPKTTTTPWVYAWYTANLVGYSLVPYLCLAVVPYFVQAASRVNPPHTHKKL